MWSDRLNTAEHLPGEPGPKTPSSETLARPFQVNISYRFQALRRCYLIRGQRIDERLVQDLVRDASTPLDPTLGVVSRLASTRSR